MSKPARRNPLQKQVRDGTFSPKVERDRTKYNRKDKHPKRPV